MHKPDSSTRIGKILMIGPSRAGKSTLVKYFKDHGLPAFDLQYEGDVICWRNDDDGKPVIKKPNPPSHEWFETHHFIMDRQLMKEFLEKNPDSISFAHSWNILDNVDLFDKVYFMYLPPDEIERRMKIERPEHTWKGSEAEVEFMKARHKQRLEDCERLGIPKIDVSQPPEAIYESFMKAHFEHA